MSYKEKYLKYKNKYLQLKNQLGGFLKEGAQIKTIRNTGEMEGMINQCFWISILNFLNSNGHPNLSLREFRHSIGLNRDTERTMFDSFNNDFHNAAIRAAEIYNLTITAYTVTSSGRIIFGAATFGNGPNIVDIAMFGQNHFELIIEDGNAFVPAIIFKNELKKIDEIEYNIDENMKKKYLELNETINNLHFYKDELKKNIKKESEIKDQEIKAIESSSEYSDEEKQFFLKIEQTNYIKLKKQNKLLTKRISELEENIASIKLIIKLYEENLI
jgi:hypothetical protein